METRHGAKPINRYLPGIKKRRFDPLPATSDLPRSMDIISP
jgi:hypothetical protein